MCAFKKYAFCPSCKGNIKSPEGSEEAKKGTHLGACLCGEFFTAKIGEEIPQNGIYVDSGSMKCHIFAGLGGRFRCFPLFLSHFCYFGVTFSLLWDRPPDLLAPNFKSWALEHPSRRRLDWERPDLQQSPTWPDPEFARKIPRKNTPPSPKQKRTKNPNTPEIQKKKERFAYFISIFSGFQTFGPEA